MLGPEAGEIARRRGWPGGRRAERRCRPGAGGTGASEPSQALGKIEIVATKVRPQRRTSDAIVALAAVGLLGAAKAVTVHKARPPR